jgi:hypothetical protein
MLPAGAFESREMVDYMNFVNVKTLTGHSKDLKAFLSDATRLFLSKFGWNDGIDARTVATEERTRNPKLKLSVDVNICYTEERR